MADEDDEFQRCEECGREIKTKRAMLAHLDRHVGVSASCRSCHRSFNSLPALNYHFDAFCGRRKVQCPQCKVLLPSTCFNSHIEAHARNNCRKCPSLFTNRKNLVAHMEDAHNIVILADAAFPCTAPGCDRNFVKRSTLFHHLQLRHAAEGEFVCLTCGTYIEGKEAFDAHVSTHKKWSCKECNESFTRRQQFLVHKLRHEQKKYRCVTCNQSFPTKLRVLEHRALGHEVAGLSEKGLCPVCGERFYTKEELRSHASLHKAEFPCKTCGQTFTSGKSLSAHIWSKHQSLLPIKEEKGTNTEAVTCDHCGKHYKSQALLAKHLNYIHREKCFACPDCDYRTKYEVNLQRHVAIHSAQPQEFYCDQCGAKFKALSNLKDHYLFVHSDERNFKCEKCDKTFKRRNDLNRHSRCHSDERVYVCHCKQTYKFVAHLRRHQRTAHKDCKGKYEKLNTKKAENLSSNSPKNGEHSPINDDNLPNTPKLIGESVVCPLPSISTLPDLSRPHELQSSSGTPAFPPPTYEDLNFVATTGTVAQSSLHLQLPIPISQFELVDQVESFMGMNQNDHPVLLSIPHINHDVVFGISGSSNQSSSDQSPTLMSMDHQDSVMISLNVAKTDGLSVNDGNELNITCGNDQVMVSHSEIATMSEFMNHQLGLDGTQDVPWAGDLEEGLALSVFN